MGEERGGVEGERRRRGRGMGRGRGRERGGAEKEKAGEPLKLPIELLSCDMHKEKLRK